VVKSVVAKMMKGKNLATVLVLTVGCTPSCFSISKRCFTLSDFVRTKTLCLSCFSNKGIINFEKGSLPFSPMRESAISPVLRVSLGYVIKNASVCNLTFSLSLKTGLVFVSRNLNVPFK